jgi:hypothetical protein
VGDEIEVLSKGPARVYGAGAAPYNQLFAFI